MSEEGGAVCTVEMSGYEVDGSVCTCTVVSVYVQVGCFSTVKVSVLKQNGSW